MSTAYRAVQWNRHKRVYDLTILTSVMLYIMGFVIITTATHPLT